jgi:cytochrome oxidase Cu insertion factor (SCO1/SenC/PrrC family)
MCRNWSFLLPLFLGLGAVGCGNGPAATGQQAAEPEAALPILAELPDFELIDEAGRSWGSSELAGQLWIASFIFTRCPTTCPMQTAQMTRLQERLRRHPRWAGMRLVSITVDPEHDTPAVLTDYARAAGAEPDRWKFLTGTRDAIWDLSNDGFNLAAGEPAEGDGPLFHSARLILVDGQRRVRGYYDGLTDEGVEALVADVTEHAETLLGR